MKKIKLWKNKNELSGKVAIVDDEDYEKVIEAIKHKRNGKEGKWYAHDNGSTKHYAMNGDRRKSIHRVVMDAPKGMDVDHANGNPLDNRKSNLRICTRSQNSQNKKLRCDSASGFKGVYQHICGRYEAYIGDPNSPATNKRSLKLGKFSSAEEAATAYDKKALELFGEFAFLNFPARLKEYK